MGVAGARKPVKPSDNPFRSGCVDALGYLPIGRSLSEIETLFRDAGYRGVLFGPHGHGKSTLMHHLARVGLPEGAAPHRVIQVADDLSNLHELKAGMKNRDGVLMVDGFDLLPWWWRWRVSRRRRVLVTTHRDLVLSPMISWMNPQKMSPRFCCETTPALLGELIARLSPSVRGVMDEGAIAALYARHHGNVRDALRELYDRVAAGEFII